MLRFLMWLSRYVLAFTFIFSGFVKGVDPLGSAYKFGDYFMAFGLDFLMPFALGLSFVLCALELLIGLLLLFDIRTVLATWGAFLFMSVFTPLTLVLAIYNPVSDCGCFGDAIILSNWETFFKNVPLLIAAIILFRNRKYIRPKLPLLPELVITLMLIAISFIPPAHGYNNLPLIDFRSYKVGTHIPTAMEIPEGAPLDEYKTLLYYQKDDVVKEFTQENFPWQDTTWTFVESKSVLVKEGYHPPISDFVLTDLYGLDVTDSILSYPGYTMLVVAYRLNEANKEALSRFNELYFKAQEVGINFACATSSPADDIDRFISSTGVAFPFVQGDEIMLKTTVRANPGLMLLNHGTIVGKWHYKKTPEPKFFEKNIVPKLMASQQHTAQNLWAAIIILILLVGKIIVRYIRLDSKNL
ncbi:MAG: DoxX family protein [Bacteroidales bacterium]|nr:DoxX family protein [Bacteroidales bacterium]MDD4673676.1 DoxX family protein [Bacteroidales bacterium]MDY0349079.1 DoxX family protein [Tenuifilaceae bacterium]